MPQNDSSNEASVMRNELMKIAGEMRVMHRYGDGDYRLTSWANQLEALADRAKNPDSEVLCVATVHERPNTEDQP